MSCSNDYLICCNEHHQTKQIYLHLALHQVRTVQLTSKFTNRVVFSHVLFETLIKTCVTHVSEQIVCEGLVHASIDRVWESSRVSLPEVQIELRT